MDEYYQKLEELINDEDKIVTLPYFAGETKIPQDKSKSIIEKYAKEHSEPGKIQVTYVLVGKKNGEDQTTVLLVRHDDLEEAKKLFDRDVEEVIFSIQRAETVDYNVMALVDQCMLSSSTDPIPGAVIGKNCFKRVLQKKVLPPLPPPTIKGKSAFFTKQNTPTKKEEKVEIKKENSLNQQDKMKTNQKDTIANMFSKVNQNKKVNSKDEKPVEKSKTNGNVNDKKNSIMNMFATKKEKESPNAAKNLEIKPELPNKIQKKSDLFDSDTDEEILKDLDMNKVQESSNKEIAQNKPTSSKNKNHKKVPKSNSKKRKNNEDTEKKRRRIIVEESGSDSDIFGSDKSDTEDLVGKSDEEPEVAKPAEKLPSVPKNKRRKAVDKTYQDEDGYIVTKTEYVYETASEDEKEPEEKRRKIEEKPVTKKNNTKPENQISPKAGQKGKKGTLKKATSGNQTSLTSFFKPK